MSPLSVSNWESGWTFLFACSVMGPLGYLFVRLDRQIRRKGYQSPFRAILMILAYLAIFAAGFLYDGRDPTSCWSCTPAANPEFFRSELLWPHVKRFMLNYSVAVTVLTAPVAAVALLLPRRVRRAGARRVRFPWKAFSYFWAACLPLTVILGVLGSVNFEQAAKLFMFCSGVYASCAYLAKRSERKPLEQVLRDDPRPPVLYLRAFDSEDETFAAVKNAECAAIGLPIRNPQSFRQIATFDEYFAREVAASLGPLIALGDPHDYLPPGGASVEYVPDDEWQARFRAMARDSVCILTALSKSENLRWELGWIRSAGFHTKLFTLTSPATKKRWYSIQWGRSSRRRWPAFAKELAACGYGAGEYAGDGSIIGFQEDGKAVPIVTDAMTPREYIQGIRRCLADRGGLRAGEPAEQGSVGAVGSGAPVDSVEPDPAGAVAGMESHASEPLGAAAAAPAPVEAAVPASDGSVPPVYSDADHFAFSNPGRLTLAIMAVCVLIAVLTLFGGEGDLWARHYAWGAKFNEAIVAGEWWRLLSAPFLHGGWEHLVFNMYALFVVGSVVEHGFGAARFLAIYVLSALGGSIASYQLSDDYGVGASGAIFGLFGASLLLLRRGHGNATRVFTKKHIGGLALWAGYSLFAGFIDPGVDNAAHLGGLVTGAAVAAVLPAGLPARALAGLCTALLAWAGFQVAGSVGTLPQVAAYSRGVDAWEQGDSLAAEREFTAAAPFTLALLDRSALRYARGDYAGAVADADSVLASGSRGDVQRKAHLNRAAALLALGLPAEALSSAIEASQSADADLRTHADTLRREALRLLADTARKVASTGHVAAPADSVRSVAPPAGRAPPAPVRPAPSSPAVGRDPSAPPADRPPSPAAGRAPSAPRAPGVPSDSRPADLTALLAAAQDALIHDRLDQAAQAVTKALELDPESERARAVGANVLFERYWVTGAEGDRSNARAFVASLEGSDDAGAYTARGNLALIDGDTAAAIEALGQAAAADPTDPYARNQLGVSLLGAGRAQAALMQLTRALELAPDMAWVQSNLLGTLVTLERCDESIPGLQRGVVAACNHRLGIMRYEAQQFDEAGQHFARAVQLAPDSGRYHADLAAALYRLGALDDAVVHAKQSRGLGVTDHWIFDALGLQ